MLSQAECMEASRQSPIQPLPEMHICMSTGAQDIWLGLNAKGRVWIPGSDSS